jgi:hypothetical protein
MTDDHKELRAMIERASENVGRMFADTGRILPMWHCVGFDGREYISPMPEGSKDVSNAIMRAFLDIHAIVRYVFIDEAWIVASPDDGSLRKALDRYESLEHHPDREEKVIFAGEDRHGHLMAHRAIIRPPRGKARLGSLELFAGDIIKGRLVHMLPERIRKPQ